jgi:plastocyanin
MVVAGCLLFGISCDRKDSPAVSRPRPVFGSGTIRGTVKFIGTPPPRETIPNKPCHDGAPELKDETVVVNADGTLANVFVYLANVPASDGSGRPAALLDQKDCHYVPHAVGVQVGQTLTVRTSDPGTMHNVHMIPQQQKNPAANFGLTTAGAEKEVKFDQAEFIRVKCDVHPWMTAYIGVFDSPFFALTSEASGSWEITKVPAGDYKLIAWHEQYGIVEQTVSVKDNEAVDVTVTYKSPN